MFFVKEKDYRYVQIAASTGFQASSCNFDLQTGAISNPVNNTFIAYCEGTLMVVEDFNGSACYNKLSCWKVPAWHC